MEKPAKATLRPPAAPRHLRRRRLRGEIPDTSLVPDAVPVALPAEDPATPAEPAAAGEFPAAAVPVRLPERATGTYRRKRRVAMTILILVSISIPLLILALILSA